MNTEHTLNRPTFAAPLPPDEHPRKRVLFVCYGNICRSPAAQGIFYHLAGARAWNLDFEVDSAGTHDFHIGKAPDARSIAATRRAGVDISGQRARQFHEGDFEAFDHIFVMDERNWTFLAERCPVDQLHKLEMLIQYAPGAGLDHVPDPFRGEEKDFDDMVRLLFDACGSALDALQDAAA